MTKTLLPGFDRPTRHRWTGGRAIEVYEGPRHCRRCSFGTVARLGPFTQHALFYHGGYGAGEQIMVDVCFDCGAAERVGVQSVRPPRR